MSHEIIVHLLGSPDREVEIDECYLTHMKYHRGRVAKTRTVATLGIYERHTKLGIHIQVLNKSANVLLSEICRFVLPGNRILTDAMPSYARLSELGYEHDVVVHQRQFVHDEDTSIHTQNAEIRIRWTKETIRSARDARTLNSYCAEYSYQSVNLRVHS